MKIDKIPVITVDGPSGSGKGTLSLQLAQALGWHFLDSGALYRILALVALKQGIALEDAQGLGALATALAVRFDESTQPPRIFWGEEEITTAIRTEKCGMAASQIAVLPAVREGLLTRQRAFLAAPGLVADGRDMGTTVFPNADLKLYLEASPEVRAQRRQSQLKKQGINVSLDGLLTEIAARDARDRQRAVSPSMPASDAIIIDSTRYSIEEVLEVAMTWVRQRGLIQE